jgi:arsenic resistance protein ArsH
LKPYKVLTPQFAMGDLNNTNAAREAVHFLLDPQYSGASLAMLEHEDDPVVRRLYRPFLLEDNVAKSDWISTLELSTVLKLAQENMLTPGNDRLKVLVLFGSLRKRSIKWRFFSYG